MTYIGTLLGDRYRLIELLGQGGMATIYRAHDMRLDRDVAIKVLRPEYGRDPDFGFRFRQEAKAAASLNHPNIVAVHDFGQEPTGAYIVMELVPGEDLSARLKREGRMEPRDAARLVADVARALEAAHARGIVHRDVKPGNILMTPDGRPKVTDFGIARAVADSELTLPGTTLGSVHYFSPEQARGEATTAASDTYSLGIVLYELLAGRRPWEGDSAASVAIARLSGPIPAPSDVRPDIPPALDAIVRKALAREPEQRFADGAAMADALDTFLSERPGTVSATGPAAASRILAAGAREPAAGVAGSDAHPAPIDGGSASPAGGRAGQAAAAGAAAGGAAAGGVAAAGVAAAGVAAQGAARAGAAAGGAARAGAAAGGARAAGAAVAGGAASQARVVGSGVARTTPRPPYAVDDYADRRLVRRPPIVMPDVDDEEEATEGRGGSLWPWVAGLLALIILAGIGFVAFQLLSAPTKPAVTTVTVPKFVGLSLDAAQTAADQAHVVLVTGVTREDPSASPGSQVVVDQSPRAGTELDQGGKVTVTLAVGTDTADVPDLRELTVAAADRLLQQNGLVLGQKTGAAYDPSVPVNTILDQDPQPHQPGVKKGSTVNYRLSKGPEPTPTPEPTATPTPEPTPEPSSSLLPVNDYRCISVNDAAQQIGNDGFQVGNVSPDGFDPAWIVQSQDPPPGSQEPPDTPINLVVSPSGCN